MSMNTIGVNLIYNIHNIYSFH